MATNKATDATEIKIDDVGSLSLASNVLRDGEFLDKDFSFDENRQRVTLIVWKHDRGPLQDASPPPTMNWYEQPWRRLELIIWLVKAVQIHVNAAGTGTHPIGGLRWDERQGILIDTYDGKTIELDVDWIEGQLRVTSEIRQDAPFE